MNFFRRAGSHGSTAGETPAATSAGHRVAPVFAVKVAAEAHLVLPLFQSKKQKILIRCEDPAVTVHLCHRA